MLFYLAFKNIISKKSSFVIMLFIAFAIAMLVVTNSVFDSTERGVQETYIDAFTGDIMIRPKCENPLSLFGDESPITVNKTDIPILSHYDEIRGVLESLPEIRDIQPQLTGMCLIMNELLKQRTCFAFGIDAESYCKAMPSIKIIEGEPWKKGEKGIMLTKGAAKQMGFSVGDQVYFAYSVGLSSRARSAPLTAIYEYSADNPVLEKIALINPELMRSLFDITEYTSAADVQLSEEKEDFFDSDLDSLFADSTDSATPIFTEEEKIDEDELSKIEESYQSSSTWNFIVCHLNDANDSKRVLASLNALFKENDWPAEAVNWRSSAGNTAFYLYLLRVILNIGIIVILIAGFIVINNTLVINVLDRIREIGTMRAIGANKRYISLECMTETLMMTICAGIVGCILGSIGSGLITLMHIRFGNSFLQQLFGNGALVTTLTFKNLAESFMISVVLGLIAWIYPVLNALSVNPVQAMQGAK